MPQSEIIAQLGAALVGNLELKAMEAWDVQGPLGYRRRLVVYGEAGSAKLIRESVYWTPNGQFVDVREEPRSD